MPAHPSPRQEQESKPAKSWAMAFGAGAQLVASVLLGFAAGQWLDGKFGTSPWLMLLGAIFGISVGLYHFIRDAAKRGSGG